MIQRAKSKTETDFLLVCSYSVYHHLQIISAKLENSHLSNNSMGSWFVLDVVFTNSGLWVCQFSPKQNGLRFKTVDKHALSFKTYTSCLHLSLSFLVVRKSGSYTYLFLRLYSAMYIDDKKLIVLTATFPFEKKAKCK